MFDRFTTCAAYYWFAVTCHGGQFSKEYKIFGRLERIKFKPSRDIEFGRLDHAAALQYHELSKAHRPDGYMHCSCRDCFELTAGAAFCSECEESECGLNQECKCEAVLDECGDNLIELTAPACWASYLINGDASGIEESDIVAADAFVKLAYAQADTVIGPTDVEECGFMGSTDGLPGIGCDAATYTFVVVK